MNEQHEIEGTGGVGRVEAFSDGVIAIVVTIMVLELHAPEAPGLAALAHLWPTFAAYALSYAYVAIYWVNHHRLFSHARRVTNGLLWANMALLFLLSLVPFSTAYVALHTFSREAVQLYVLTMLLPAVAYSVLQKQIRHSSPATPASQAYHRATTRKGYISLGIYGTGLGLAFAAPWAGVACAALVALLWFLPASRIDAWFSACGLN